MIKLYKSIKNRIIFLESDSFFTSINSLSLCVWAFCVPFLSKMKIALLLSRLNSTFVSLQTNKHEVWIHYYERIV